MNESAHRPEHCVWELTLRCNMRCLHCGSAAGTARRDELGLPEALDVADQLLDLGCRHVTLIGGEVFLYDGWQRVARRIVDSGGRVNIITNGWLMGDEQIRQIREAKLDNVGISVDGMEESHNRIRGVRSSFRRVLAAFDRLRAEGLSIGVVTSLLDFNVGDLRAMYDLFVERGVGVWQIQIANAMGNLADGRPLLLSPEKLPDVTRFIAERRSEGKLTVYAGDDVGYYDQHEPIIRSAPGEFSIWQGCQAGLKVVGVDSVGNVKGCESLYDDRFIEGNLRTETLAEIWRKPDAFAYNRRFDPSCLQGRCAECDMAGLCRAGCRGTCYFTTGSLYENPYCCYPAAPAHAATTTYAANAATARPPSRAQLAAGAQAT